MADKKTDYVEIARLFEIGLDAGAGALGRIADHFERKRDKERGIIQTVISDKEQSTIDKVARSRK